MADIDELFSCFDEVETIAHETVETSTEHQNETTGQSNSETKLQKRVHDKDMEPNTRYKRRKAEVEVNISDLNLENIKERIVVHKIESLDSCTHEVVIPPKLEYIPLSPMRAKPVKSYKFTLDPFQKESILCIDNSQSVLVSAHTSAGKTVVAEYAIALSLANNQRVIYTTPIKALSNQKYREFLAEFKDVGLVTGDVTINPSASCLIMTTEILRNMLYRGSEIMREVGWVIFDEIHYMRDKERGVVWEETLILLPHNVRFVFLSATIPNARQFAEWVAHLHRQPCHVVYTEYRPTPLQHFIYPAGGQGVHMVVDESGTFKDANYNAAMAALQTAGEASKGDQKGRRGGIRDVDPTESNIYKVLKMIMERCFCPAIIFSFSKKECETYAMQMVKLDFNSPTERALVDEVFNNAMEVLTPADRNLPQVENLLPLLRRGIAIHHGGLLPILKETIEILFSEGLIKALFATETFAMGLNMPARTVLFTGIRKFDGAENRWITSGEYIQMSGRAGRRGIDDKGIIILLMTEKIPAAVGRQIIKGQADPINSAFHLTYNMVLNLLRVEEINPEYMLERSFYQFQNQTAIPTLYEDYVNKVNEYNDIKIINEEQIASYYEIREELDSLGNTFREYIIQPEYLIPFLQPGRLVKIKHENDEYDWGIIVNYKKINDSYKKQNPKNPTKTSTKILVDVLLKVLVEDKTNEDKRKSIPKPPTENDKSELDVIPVMHKFIYKISALRVHCPDDLRSKESRKGMLKVMNEIRKRFPDDPPLLNPITEMNIKDPEFKTICEKIEKLEKKMYSHEMHNHQLLQTEYDKFIKKSKVGEEIKVAKEKLLAAKSVLQLDELKCRKRVLRRLHYCTNSDVIELKGRVACELSSADELLITELIFNGVFGNLNPGQCAALLSCFVCDDKSQELSRLSEELSGSLRTMQELARKIAKVSVEARLTLDEEGYVERFKPHLMDVVYAWCKGKTFSEVCKMTDIFEGSIIRSMRRLEELLRQMCQAAKTIGNSELENKFATAIKLLKRDIIFAASLYL